MKYKNLNILLTQELSESVDRSPIRIENKFFTILVEMHAQFDIIIVSIIRLIIWKVKFKIKRLH